jgi:hypothetical protein
MKPIKALRHVVGNVDNIRELVGRLTVAADVANTQRDRLFESFNNQSTDSNARLDKLIDAVREQTRAISSLTGPRAGNAASAAMAASSVAANLDESSPKLASTPAAWLLAESPAPLSLPDWSGTLANGAERHAARNALEDYQPLLDVLGPWRGMIPKGFRVDFFGILTDANFRTLFGIDPATIGGEYTTTEVPKLLGDNGEWWFEAINWIEAARAARDHFVMITLGAAYGAQAVGAHRVLQMINPMPSKLTAVEPVPENHLWLRKHFRDNGLDPDQHWIVSAAISDTNDPVYFPVGGAGSGANNCIATDTLSERKSLLDGLIAQGRATEVLCNIMLHNTTGVMKDLLPGQGIDGEIQVLSAVTLRDLLSPFERVDYLEADIQQSEARVFPPYIELLRKKVRRIHLGTHGAETHSMLHTLFEERGWEIVFSYPPDGVYDSRIGSFSLNDGVLTVRNPDLK